MSWICLEDNRTIRTRKSYYCDACGQRIAKGIFHVTRSGVESGQGFYRMRLHVRCAVATSQWDSWDWETANGSLELDREELVSVPCLPIL